MTTHASLLMRRELKSAETWVDGKTWYKTLCYWLMSQWIQQSANSRQFYIKFTRPLKFQQIWARDSSVVACPEWHPAEKKVLRWDFHNFGLHYTHTYQNNWIWNQNQRKFWENEFFSFQIVKYCLILKVFDTFSLCNFRTKRFWA